MEMTPALPLWAQLAINVLTLIMGGGAVWAYLTRRRETDSERIARYEGRIDARLDMSERDRDALRVQVGDLDKRLAVALHQLDDAIEERDELRGQVAQLALQNRMLIELLRKHGVEIPPELLLGQLTRHAPAQAAEEQS